MNDRQAGPSGTERVAVTCPACSPGYETVHEVLKPGGQATVRCSECGHTHQASLEPERTVERDVVVSQDGESFAASVEAPAAETVAVGEEFVLETEEAILGVRITDLQVGPEERVEEAPVEDVTTFWTRAVDNVTVNVTVHPNDGAHDETRSVEVGVPGDYEFEVGGTEELGGETFTVEGLLIRDDASGYPAEKLDRRGDTAVAKDLKRVYARDASPTAWSAW